MSACYHLLKAIRADQPNLIIGAGIAGAFSNELNLGDVVVVTEEQMGDLGVEENQQFFDHFDLGLEEKNKFPFENGTLSSSGFAVPPFESLKKVRGLTVNQISTDHRKIELLVQK